MVSKPAHLLAHPSVPGNPPTLLDGLQAFFVYEIAIGGQISLINRLDRETSGLVLVAKHRDAAREMSIAMERREFQKTYEAIVSGWPEEGTFVVDGPLLRAGEIAPSPIWVRQIVHPDGKPCRTRFDVIDRLVDRETDQRFAHLRCFPETGRMHQIRAHLHHVGLPIVGDKLYGPDPNCYLEFIETGWTASLSRKLLLDRQALHASALGWRQHLWHSPLPAQLSEFIECKTKSMS